MITKMFEGNGIGKKHCWYCIGVIELAVDMPR